MMGFILAVFVILIVWVIGVAIYHIWFSDGCDVCERRRAKFNLRVSPWDAYKFRCKNMIRCYTHRNADRKKSA